MVRHGRHHGRHHVGHHVGHHHHHHPVAPVLGAVAVGATIANSRPRTPPPQHTTVVIREQTPVTIQDTTYSAPPQKTVVYDAKAYHEIPDGKEKSGCCTIL